MGHGRRDVHYNRSLSERYRKLLPAACALAISWLNVYICRELFLREHTGYMNAMHGYWMAIARLVPFSHWWQPAWWPYSFCGMPAEYTYSPLVPGAFGQQSMFEIALSAL